MKDIPGFEGEYAIDEEGKVWSYPRTVVYQKPGRFLRPGRAENHYDSLALTSHNGAKISVAIHRLVALTYLPNPENKPFVNHKDGDKRNNSVSNLEWCTEKENSEHAWKTGLMDHARYDRRGSRNPKVRLTEANVIEIKRRMATGKINQCAVAREFGVSRGAIGEIFRGTNWKHIVL